MRPNAELTGLETSLVMVSSSVEGATVDLGDKRLRPPKEGREKRSKIIITLFQISNLFHISPLNLLRLVLVESCVDVTSVVVDVAPFPLAFGL